MILLKLLLPMIVALSVPLSCSAYNILFMAPFPAPSHWLWLENFMRDLLNRGHHLTVVNNHPTKQPHQNLTEIIIDPKFDIPKHFPLENIFKMQYTSNFESMQFFWHAGQLTSDFALNDPKVKKLINSNKQHFDLLILEQWFHESFLMFSHKFNCPVVTICTMSFADHMDHLMGMVTPLATTPHFLLSYTDEMSFMQRVENTYLSLYDNVWRRWYYMPKMQEMAEKHFSKAIAGTLPSLRDLEKNISLMLVNSHRSFESPRPSMPGLIAVGGAHIKAAKPLPNDLQSFLDNSTNGVIFFTLGSYMKSTDMPADKINLLLNAFSRLKQNVLWKFENETMGHLPENVMIKKWMPQNDILAHPNVKVFMTHSGIFGTQEGMWWGVPMLCIPLYGDQIRNAKKSVHGGSARMVPFLEMTTDNIIENLQILIQDPSYKRKALEISGKFRDNPMHPLDEASYWIEYVARYKGAPHFKSYGAFMPLYQYLLLDVLGCVLLALALAMWLPWKILKWTKSFLSYKGKTIKADKKLN